MMWMHFWPSLSVGFGTDYQALTEKQIAAQMAAQAHMMRNSDGRGLAYLMANYRPPVVVPEGWADWFAHGDEI